MRLSFLLLAAAFTLLSSGSAVSAVTNDEVITSPNQVLSREAEGRHLRVHKSTRDDTEERGFSTSKFDQLMNDSSYRSKRFANWVKKNYTDRDVDTLLQTSSNPHYKRIFHYYQNYVEHYAPHLFNKLSILIFLDNLQTSADTFETMRLSLLVQTVVFTITSSGNEVSAMTNGYAISALNQVLSSESEGRRLRAHKNTDDTEERLNLEKLNKHLSRRQIR